MRLNIIGRAALIFTAFMAVSFAPVKADPLYLTLAGASPGGLWTLLGAGLDSALKESSPGSLITYQTSGGGFANAAMISQGRAEIGLIHDAELAIAVDGDEPFKGPLSSLRTIGYLYDWAPMQFIATKSFADEHNIKSIGDFSVSKAPVRITVNRAGNITGRIATAMLDAAGATDSAVNAWGGSVIAAGSSEQSSLFQNGRVNVFTNGVFVGHSSIRELENAVDIKLLSVPQSVLDKIGKQFSIRSFTIPAGSYKNQPEAIETLALGAVLIANDSMSEEHAYQLTKAMINNIDRIRAVHPAMAALNLKLLTTKTAAPFHDGALRAYREAGLM
ncbi:TAXI family TRAP transporter solute-binding subunit [Alcaligenaceae bacterium CGII-47]|nr:TAXI family TRAP transporter solute-binding subunit [Alcaligenaceae bacterium CGII-47]